MLSINYHIRTIQQKLISEYGFAEDPRYAGVPQEVPDGEYPMTIDGKVDNVLIKDGKIQCCRFVGEEAPEAGAA